MVVWTWQYGAELLLCRYVLLLLMMMCVSVGVGICCLVVVVVVLRVLQGSHDVSKVDQDAGPLDAVQGLVPLQEFGHLGCALSKPRAELYGGVDGGCAVEGRWW